MINLSTKILIILNINSDIKTKIKTNANIFKFNTVKAKNSLKPINVPIKPKIKIIIKPNLNLFKGKHILNNNKKPVNPVIITHNVDICTSFNLKKFPNTAIITIFKTIVNDVGKDLLKTLIKKLPLIRLLLGSKANINDGTPIVKKLVKVS